MSERQVKLFVSSPSDVRPERDRVVAAAERLNGTFEGLIRINVIRWEDEFYDSSRSFQEQIDAAVGKMAEIDILVCILWGRIGLRLSPMIWKRDEQTGYESGTVYEYEVARARSEENGGVPSIYLFRKSAQILYRADHAAEDSEQHRLLEAVWQRWTQSPEGYNSAAYHGFSDPDDFEKQLDGCLRRWLETQGIALKGPVWDRRVKGSPFCGLAAFEPSHSTVFFGREAAIASILAKLRVSTFLLLIGASGTGKSSLLRAGLVPRIVRPGAIPDVDLWRVAVITPSKDPFLDLAQSLFADACLKEELEDNCGSIDALVELMRQGNKGLILIGSALRRAADKHAVARNYVNSRPARILLAIDQLERLFVEARADEIDSFAKFIRNLVHERVIYLVVTLRSDAYASFQSVADFSALRESGATHDLLKPNPLELEDIVMRPVSACYPSLTFENNTDGKSLASILVENAKGGDFLPLLQMTLEFLFQAEKKRGDGTLRFSDYGGIEQAVIQVASEAFSTIDEAARASVPALITALVHDVSLDTITAQRTVTLQPVRRVAFERGRSERVALVDAFVAHRLLTVEDYAGEIWIRAVHDALLRVWPEAVKVLIENENIIRVRRTLEPLVEQWTETGKLPDSDLLLTSPALLAGARQLVERVGDDISPAMRAYIESSLAAESGRVERESQRRNAIMSATGEMRAHSIPYYRLIAGLLVSFFFAVRIVDPPIVQWLGLLAFDSYQQLSPRQTEAMPVLVVDIDEASLKEFGQYPWPRTLLADLVNRLFELGAVAVGFDIVFSEPDRQSPTVLANAIKGLDPETRDKLSSLPSNDEVFAKAIQRWGRVVVGESGNTTGGNNSGDDRGSRTSLVVQGSDPHPFLFKFPSLLRNVAVIDHAVAGRGLITTIPERDDIVRRLPTIVEAQGLVVPSLPVEMLRIASGNTAVLVKSSEAGIESVGLLGLHFATDENGRVWIHFSGHKPARFISAADVLNERPPSANVGAHLVIVGSSAVGLNDVRATPVSSAMPGAEIQAEVIENILTGSLLRRPAALLPLELGSIIVIGILFSLLMPRLSARMLAAVSVLVLAAVAGGSWAAFKYWKLLIDPVYPLITAASFVAVMTFFIYRHSENQRGKIRGFFDSKVNR
jgi:CHASE2 domain-containing sensor protein